MATEKISAEARRKYSERVKEYKQAVEQLEAQAKKLEAGLHGAPKALQEGADPEALRLAGLKRFELAGGCLNQVAYFCLMHALSLSLLGVKNEAYLNEARKCCYRAIIFLEEAVTPLVDAAYSEYEAGVESLGEIGDGPKYLFLRKLGFAIESVAEGFGAYSKWKWSFVELEGRYAVVAKNLLNLKTFLAQLDPRVPGYSERLAHIKLAKRLLQQSADRYREKYELSTLRLDDIKQAVLFLSALKRLHALLGEAEEAEVVKKKMEIWKVKMEDDQRKQELAAKTAKVRRSPEG
jgi:galactokinase